MMHILDGNSEKSAYALRKLFLFEKKFLFVTDLDLIKRLKQIQ